LLILFLSGISYGSFFFFSYRLILGSLDAQEVTFIFSRSEEGIFFSQE